MPHEPDTGSDKEQCLVSTFNIPRNATTALLHIAEADENTSHTTVEQPIGSCGDENTAQKHTTNQASKRQLKVPRTNVLQSLQPIPFRAFQNVDKVDCMLKWFVTDSVADEAQLSGYVIQPGDQCTVLQNHCQVLCLTVELHSRQYTICMDSCSGKSEAEERQRTACGFARIAVNRMMDH